MDIAVLPRIVALDRSDVLHVTTATFQSEALTKCSPERRIFVRTFFTDGHTDLARHISPHTRCKACFG